MWSPVGGAESPKGDGWYAYPAGIVCGRLTAGRSIIRGIHLHACPARGYFSVKKSNQKSLGEDPETPYASVRPDRKVYDLPDLGLDDAYKVDF